MTATQSSDPSRPAADSETALRAQLASDPMRHDAALALALLLLRDGRVDEAVDLLAAHAADRACGDLLREYFIGERMHDEALRLIEGRPSEASASALVDRAVAAHLRGDLDSALTSCRLAIAAEPNHAPAWNHQGRALFNARRAEPARAAFAQALQLAEDYPEAWHNFAHVLRDANDFEGAERAYRNAVLLRPGYRSARLNLGVVQMALGRSDDALETFGELLAVDPAHAEGWFNLGLCQHLRRQYEEAQQAYERAIALDPGNGRARLQYGRLCNELLETDAALEQFRKALDLDPRNPEPWVDIAMVYEQANRLEDAERAIAAGIAIAPRNADLRLEQAKIARRRNDLEAALSGLRAIDLRALHPRMHQQYHYELGWALDRSGDHAGALAAFERGNAMAARSPRAQATDMGAYDRQLDAIEAWLRDGAPAPAHDPDEDNGDDLCFLFGFPRSGTTLLDVMLDGHPDVASIEEKSTIERLVLELSGQPGGYPAAMATLDRDGRDALRASYRQAIAHHLGERLATARLVVDKMPIRSVHAAFIQRLFPRARLLFSLRHPCDVVLSNFMQQYAANEVFVHFSTLAESARIYDRVMRIWETTLKTLPLRTEYVRYEDLVADAGHALRTACAFLDLPWRDDLVEHRKHLEKRKRIATNSYHQVAEPIYKRAIGRWEGYRDALAPSLPALRRHAEFFGYVVD